MQQVHNGLQGTKHDHNKPSDMLPFDEALKHKAIPKRPILLQKDTGKCTALNTITNANLGYQ